MAPHMPQHIDETSTNSDRHVRSPSSFVWQLFRVDDSRYFAVLFLSPQLLTESVLNRPSDNHWRFSHHIVALIFLITNDVGACSRFDNPNAEIVHIHYWGFQRYPVPDKWANWWVQINAGLILSFWSWISPPWPTINACCCLHIVNNTPRCPPILSLSSRWAQHLVQCLLEQHWPQRVSTMFPPSSPSDLFHSLFGVSTLLFFVYYRRYSQDSWFYRYSVCLVIIT